MLVLNSLPFGKGDSYKLPALTKPDQSGTFNRQISVQPELVLENMKKSHFIDKASSNIISGRMKGH